MIEVPITDCRPASSTVEVTDSRFPRHSRIPIRINPAITITYDEWCKLQADRINHSGGHARVRYSREDKVMMCEVTRPPTEIKDDGEEDEK